MGRLGARLAAKQLIKLSYCIPPLNTIRKSTTNFLCAVTGKIPSHFGQMLSLRVEATSEARKRPPSEAR